MNKRSQRTLICWGNSINFMLWNWLASHKFAGWALEQDLGAFSGTDRCPRDCNYLYGYLYPSNIFTMLRFSFCFIPATHVISYVRNWFTDINFFLHFFSLLLFVSGLDLLKYLRVRMPLKFYSIGDLLPFIMGSINFITRSIYIYIYIVKIEASG